MDQEQKQTVTIDGKTYDFNALPPDIQNMVMLYNSWNSQLVQNRTEVIKLECAIRALTEDILKAMPKSEDAEKIQTDVPLPTVPEQTENKFTGTVKWFNDAKGYGFISIDTNPIYKDENFYVHYSEIKVKGFKTLNVGQRVSFTVENKPLGRCAINVIPL